MIYIIYFYIHFYLYKAHTFSRVKFEPLLLISAADEEQIKEAALINYLNGSYR